MLQTIVTCIVITNIIVILYVVISLTIMGKMSGGLTRGQDIKQLLLELIGKK